AERAGSVAERAVAKRRWFLALTVVATLWLPPAVLGAEPSDQASASEKTKTLWFIPHTHWEGAVFKTRDEYLDIGLPIILKVLKLLKEHPDYRFVLDQVSYVKPFLERYPEEKATFRKFVGEGRLQLVGGTDIMPDVNIPSGESFVRQILYGKGYYRDTLGVDVTVGWQLDTFGHHAQMPQLLKLGGYKSFWFFRGVADMDTPSEFLWEGIDGSRIAAFWLPQGYAIAYGSPKTLPAFSWWMKRRFDLLERQCPFGNRVGLAGADVCEPEEHLPMLVAQHNRPPDALQLKYEPLPKTISAELTTSGEVPKGNYANVCIYEAETLSHQCGHEEADAEAGNKRTWVARPTKDKPSHIVYGPYEEYPPGKYLAIYRMKLLETTDKDIATVDASIGGRLYLGSRKLTADDLQEGKFASVPLMIDVTESQGGRLEFRVNWHGNASLALDSITVFQLEADSSKPQGPKVAPLQLRIALPTDYEKVVAARPDRPVIKGELNPIFQGIYSSRIELKQWTRELERLLTTAEELGALCNWLEMPTDDQAVWRAWEPVLFNQAHDLASGVMTDKVYEDTVRGFEFSKRLAEELVESRLNDVLSQIDTRGEGIPVMVFNTLSWPRTDVAEVEVGFSDRGVGAIDLLDPAGQPVPIQFLQTQRYSDGGLRRAKIAFLARNVPALGYSVYRLRQVAAESKPHAKGDEPTDSIENEHYRATFNLLTGEMTGLTVKSGDWQVFDGPANVVARQHDAGDLWELYHPLDGGSRIAMKNQQPVPTPGEAKFSNEETGDRGSVVAGPVFSEFQVSHPFGSQGAFTTTVRMVAGSRRIEIRTQILNNAKFVRYQVLFPTSIKDGVNVHEIPFGAIGRPAGIEFPAQNWIDYGNGEKGLALLNRGLPGNLVTDGTMMLSLMRSTRIVAYGFSGGYERGMSSDSGFELDKELTFHYALVPHAGDWCQAEIYRQGLEFNRPLIVRKAHAHAGTLAKRWGLLEVSHPNCVISALKPGKGGTIVLRVYEAIGKPAPGVKIKFRAKVTSAHEANLMEDPGHKLEAPD
ncbi:MAG: glycoside hydrolase family 38 C-terminal domain-containing protein, partial [Pirellulaceae bacterium]